jgi:endonuclease/exonuclease/phosphatase family metal-dependent hydrolase
VRLGRIDAGSTLAHNAVMFVVATFNTLNLALPHTAFYDNAQPYGEDEYGQRRDWIGAQLDALGAHVVAVQEVFHLRALREAVGASRWMKDAQIIAPGIPENHASATSEAPLKPRLALLSRLPVIESTLHEQIAPEDRVAPPGMAAPERFSRPVLEALIAGPAGPIRVITVHLKSKRPALLAEERESDPAHHARGMARSLAIRASEALALRQIIIQRLWRTREPLVVLGDFNDLVTSPTTVLVAATRFMRGDESQRDCMLFDAFDLQKMRQLPFAGVQRRDTSFTHTHEQVPETIDHILVSEEFAPFSKNAVGWVHRVDYFNDHLGLRRRGEREARIYSDHGQVVATLHFHGTAPAASEPLSIPTTPPNA